MNFEERFSEIYSNYSIEISKLRLIRSSNNLIYKDFPHNFPSSIKEHWLGVASKVIDIFDSEAEKRDSLIKSFSADDAEILICLRTLQQKKKFFNGEEVIQHLNRQEIISYFTFLEAYLQDIRRLLFEMNINLLANENQSLTLNEVIAFKSLDELHNYIIEKKLEKSGFDKVYEIIEILNRPDFLLGIKINKKQLHQLKRQTLIRNLIIHNGSKISKDLIKHCPEENCTLNNQYYISDEELRMTFFLTMAVIDEVYFAISIKYFGKERESLLKDNGRTSS